MSKKYRSKWFRVAVEGATIDGRSIDRKWIEEAAANYDRNTYGARVWIEHLRSLTADDSSLFPAVGDVLALKAEEVSIGGEKKLALYAQIEPTEKLVEIVNTRKQKIYTSVEITPKFADTGQAYLTGLGVTDSPASLGTEALVFSAVRRQRGGCVYSPGEETLIEFEEADTPSRLDALFARLETLLGGKPARPHDPGQEHLPALVREFAETARSDVAELRAALDRNATALAELRADVTALRDQLSATSDGSPPRPVVAGAHNIALTEF